MERKKKIARIQFNKDNIILAAKDLFENRGVMLTTVDDIAKEADCSKSTLYVYFKGKEDILNHIILEQMVLLKSTIKKCTSKEIGFEDCYFLICKELVKLQKKYPVYYELLLGEIRITQEDIKEDNINAHIYQVGEEINVCIGAKLKEGIENKEVRQEIEIVPTIFFLWSGISDIIRFANQKEDYFKFHIKMKKEDYMNYAFRLLFMSIASEAGGIRGKNDRYLF